jgi:hypothetical protein
MALINQKTEYSRLYGDFRGADFSSDETLVNAARFPYIVNMYKDYFSGAGQGVETIPGFRRRFTASDGARIYGIHSFDTISGENLIVVHAGTKLYNCHSMKGETAEVIYSNMNTHDSVSFVFNNRLYLVDGKNYIYFDGKEVKKVADEAYIPTTYINIIPNGENANSGTEYEQRNVLQPKFKHTFIADGETADFFLNERDLDSIDEVKVYGHIVTNYEVNTKEGQVTFTEPPKKPEDAKFEEMYAGIEITASKAVYKASSATYKTSDGGAQTVVSYGETESEAFISLIATATIACVFDNRVFLSGFKDRPNLLFYCERASDGIADPSYIGILDYIYDGVDNIPITAMLPIPSALLVLKGDTKRDGVVYYHTPYETGEHVIPKIYPAEQGLAGIGCLGAACNFLDDPVFVSRLGLEAISTSGMTAIKYERAREHRSSLVDSKLINVAKLNEAKLCEWQGYLMLLIDGQIFMADSRQAFANALGIREYEWYYLEDIGVYDGQYKEYKYLNKYPDVFLNEDGSRKIITVTYAGQDIPVGIISDIEGDYPPEERLSLIDGEYEGVSYLCATVLTDEGVKAFFCEETGAYIGGEFKPAVNICSIIEKGNENIPHENVLFGTTNGVVCSFNFDMRDRNDGLLPSEAYSFDNRAIYSGCALKMDNCDIPHMNKTTVKKSTVVKVKNFYDLAAKVRVLTNKNKGSAVGELRTHRFFESLFSAMDFSDFAFAGDSTSIFALKEKEKKWVEKQYCIYSDEYQKPFSLFYLAYKYTIAGRYKN